MTTPFNKAALCSASLIACWQDVIFSHNSAISFGISPSAYSSKYNLPRDAYNSFISPSNDTFFSFAFWISIAVLDFFITFSEVFATVSVTPDKFFLSSSKNAIILPSCMNCMYYFWLLSCIVKNLFVSITIIYLYVRPVTSSLKVFRRFNLP